MSSTVPTGRMRIWYDPVEVDLSHDASDDENEIDHANSQADPGQRQRPHVNRPFMTNRRFDVPPPPPPLQPPPPPPQTPPHPASVKSQPFRIYPGSSIIFQPDPSSSMSSSDDEGSDTSGATTDPGEKLSTLLAAAMSSKNAMMPNRILKRMSSVTLLEEDAKTQPNGRRVKPATTASTTPASSSTSPSSAAGSESEEKSPEAGRGHRASGKENAPRIDIRLGDKEYQYDSDDERRYMREVEGIPLNCMTQERVHYPRKRPAPSPATGMHGQQQSGSGAEYTWKRHSHQPAPEPASPRMRNSSLKYPSTSERSGPHGSASLKMEGTTFLRKLESEAATGTLLVYQPTCLDHHNDTHQENRERLGVLCGPKGVLHKDRFKDLRWANLNELKPARLNDMLRVHSFEYIQHLERVCGLLPEQDGEYSVGRLYEESDANDGMTKDLTYSDWIKVRYVMHRRKDVRSLMRCVFARSFSVGEGEEMLCRRESTVSGKFRHGRADLQEQLFSGTPRCRCCLPRH